MVSVNTKDLKSLPFWECQFESLAELRTLIMSKTIIISDNNNESLKIKKQIIKVFKRKTKKIQCLIVIGGDSFMLKTLKKIKD